MIKLSRKAQNQSISIYVLYILYFETIHTLYEVIETNWITSRGRDDDQIVLIRSFSEVR